MILKIRAARSHEKTTAAQCAGNLAALSSVLPAPCGSNGSGFTAD
jgi:hypothetical protein